jgi:hypothetical protein
MGGSVAERAVEPKRNESLRQQFETTIQENIKQAIFCLPLDQLELFDSFLVEQQKQFNSIFLSQRVNHLYQKYVQHMLKREMKYFEAQAEHYGQANLAFDGGDMSRLSGIGMLMRADPQRREFFYDFCIHNVKCVNKEYNQADYHVSMNIEWLISLPDNNKSEDQSEKDRRNNSSSGSDEENDRRAIKEEKKSSLHYHLQQAKQSRPPQGKSSPAYVNFYCYYNGDNEGMGLYSWECMKKIQEFQDYSNESVKLHPSDEFETIFEMLSLSPEECSQLFTFLLRNSFWNDI